MSSMAAGQLSAAIHLIQAGKIQPARDLLLAVIQAEPDNLEAWTWALKVAANKKEQQIILARIEELDPSRGEAAPLQAELEPERRTQANPHPTSDKKSPQEPEPNKVRSTFSGLLKLSLNWAASLPPGCSFITIFLGIVLIALIYTRVNSSLFGLSGADLDDLVISNSFRKIASDDFYWELEYEGSGQVKYLGSVRHVAPIRIREFSILTHDILVTSGDFSNPDVVRTNVIDHKFFWKSPNDSSPEGTINLIHAIPATKEIYLQMLDIRKWDTVVLSGREILTVKAYQANTDLIGTWMDTGCNTLLVESVIILN